MFDDAVNIARQADVAIVNVGFNESSERESNDRPFRLPEYQDSLVRCVASVNPKTVVLLNSGAGVDMTRWIGDVPSLLQVWYAGQEGGTAIAEILTGKVNPSGKLPMTFDRRWEDNPAFPYYYDEDGDNRVTYGEGIFMGYRHYDSSETEPLFAFGHGLSYTDFKYSGLKVMKTGDNAFKVSFNVWNSGDFDGAETAQLYIAPVAPAVERPCKELKGFEKKFIRKGETVRMEIELDSSSFSYYDVDSGAFRCDPGKYRILVGDSSDNILLSRTVKL